MKNFALITLSFISFFIHTQEAEEPVDPNIERVEKIQDLINRVERNRADLSKSETARVDDFIKKSCR